MILYDFSSLIHRAIHTSIKQVNPHKKDGKYITNEFIPATIFRIVEEVLDNFRTYKYEYNNLVICLDNHEAPYWRKRLYPPYKEQRKKEREESEVNFNEVFKHLDILMKVLNDFTPFKCISVPGAEADDIIGTLTRKFAKSEKILILSPDKDFKQLHKFGNVKQFSAITNKWIINDEPEEWEKLHICLGDAVDNVPRIVDFSEFTKEFKDFFKDTELSYYKLSFEKQREIESKFKELNPDHEVFKKNRFGKTNLEKKIKEFGSLDKFINSNDIYRLNFERNKKLVLDSEIPINIEIEILNRYSDSSTKFDMQKIAKYFSHYEIQTCIQWFEQLSNELSKPTEMNEFNVNFNKIF